MRRAFARLSALARLGGLHSRTTTAVLLAACAALDLVLLERPLARLALTALQCLGLPVTTWTAVRALRRQTTPARARSARSWAYLATLCVTVIVAAAEKCWIALRLDAASAYLQSYRVLGMGLTLAGLALLMFGGRRVTRYFASFAEHPARQTAASFFALAVLGAFLLSLPVSLRNPARLSFLDALFMATSAVCVTGLSVHEVASEYTAFGQAVLLALVQAGGIGIMVLSASVLVLTGRRLRARSSAALAEMLDADSLASLRGSIRRIVTFTLTLEAVGALLLYVSLSAHDEAALDFASPHPMAGSGSRLWAAVFHAVSAFCNAGFTLNHGGLVAFSRDYATCSIVIALIVLGGVGFPVLSELAARLIAKAQGQRPPRASLHLRTVLSLHGGLTLVGACLFLATEWNHTLAGRSLADASFHALFQSVTLRTAGFATVDIASMSHAATMACMLLMFVGASPGGTGGGIKVTTLATLFATLRAELRGDEFSRLFDRRLPRATVRRAIAVTFVSLVVLTTAVLLLLWFEPFEPLQLAFEAVSAFATVGLSADLTPRLDGTGKLVLIVTMLIGRVGPLTVALAASERTQRAHHQYPNERVLIG